LHPTGASAQADQGTIVAAGIALQIVNERIDYRLARAGKNPEGILSVIDYIGVVYRKPAGVEYRNTVASGIVSA
jgi:hypothetical protein